MAKFILGIIAVACLHIGFVAFMANDRAEESARMLIESAPETALDTGEMVPPASLSVYDEPQVTLAAAVEPIRKVYIPVYINRRVKVEERSYEPVRGLKRDSSVKLGPSPEERTFEARIIEPRVKETAKRSEADQRDLIYELATMKGRKTEKRSFVASNVVPVVKKPWEFIKAVGDKLR